jgi:hypothetical protein
VLVHDGDAAFLVHLTWTGREEKSPRPLVERITSADEFERMLQFRR